MSDTELLCPNRSRYAGWKVFTGAAGAALGRRIRRRDCRESYAGGGAASTSCCRSPTRHVPWRERSGLTHRLRRHRCAGFLHVRAAPPAQSPSGSAMPCGSWRAGRPSEARLSERAASEATHCQQQPEAAATLPHSIFSCKRGGSSILNANLRMFTMIIYTLKTVSKHDNVKRNRRTRRNRGLEFRH